EGSESFTVTINSITNGGLEDVRVDSVKSSVETTITDDSDEVKVTLVPQSEVFEGTDTVTFTVKVESGGIALTEPLVVTLSDKQTVTIPAGQTEATVTVKVNNGEDVYKDPSKIELSITKAESAGKEFEKLTVDTDVKTVNVNDTPNIVYVDVTASSTNLIEGAGVTYTVTLRNQDGLEVKNHGGLNITLSNGVKITIPAGQDSGTSSEVKAPLGSNTIKVQTIVETAKADSGKQFEDIQSGKTVTVNASSSTLKNDIATATENGSENVASEDSLDTINGKNDGQTASGNVLRNDSNVSEVSKITFEGSTKSVSNDGTEIIGKYGTLTINSKGKFTYKLNDENPDVDKLNVGDKLADNFTYVTSNGKTAVLTVEVEGRNDAPIISKIETNGVTLTGIYNDYRSDNISENITAKDLIKNDGSKSYQFKNENNTLKMDLGTTKTNVDIRYEGKNASYKNILGYYEKNADGTIGNLKIIFVDGSDTSAKSIQGITGEIGFFLIPTGANNTNIMNIINGGNYQVERTEDGKIIFSGNGKLATASDVYYTDESLSTEKKDHTIALKSDNPNSIIIGFEDQPLKDGSTDFDYNDFVISVKFTPSESLTNKLFKNVDFSDVDDDNLSEATVTLTNAIDGDKINIAGDLKEGITYTTEYKDGKLIIKFSGIASHEAYEEALEAIRFSTKNSENERELKFEIEIKDPNGKTDKNSVVIIGKGFDNDTPTIGDERVETKEDISYTFSIKDFDSYKDVDGDSIETIKIVTLPDPKTEGTLKYDGVVITAGKEILVKDLGKLVFEPVSNSDKNASFTFQVSDSRGAYSDIKTMTIEVEAVADAPIVSIDIKSAGTIEVSTGNGGNGNGENSSGIKKLDILKVESNCNGNETIDKDYNYSGNDDITKNYQNLNSGATNITTDKGNDALEFQSLNSKNINSGAGDDKIIINQGSSTSNIQLGEGNNSYTVAHSLNAGTTQSGAGNDTVIVNQGASNTTINLGDGNNTISIGEALNNSNISTGNGNDTLIVGQASDNNTISTGGGNDFVQLNHNVQGTKIDLGTGNDGIRLSNEGHVNFNTETLIDGGADFDTLYLNGKETDYWIEDANHNKITYSQYVQENKDINGYANKLFYIYEVDGNGTKQGSGFTIKNVEDIIFEQDKTENSNTTTVYKYDITVSATLTDKDSEELSNVTIKNIPVGSTLYNGEVNEANKLTANPDGSYTVKVDANGEAKLSLTSKSEVSQDKLDDVQVSATSTDKSTDGTSEVSQAISFDGSGDIDLSNLKNIITELKEINLENGKENKLSLTLDDVLKISGEDNTIKISRDKFDSVTFKDTIGDNGKENAWSKTEGTGADKGYDIYMNSGDPTVQVKVEQPISDGITN
ncbi:immunoglobulin-like domain-containing protein, partial [Aliarcobacter butzleri]|uniref:immunoglobulin-like domain-containing protein n=1 Tax=Aliarcobacter butzleri TaxID=28197 RepID=UPI002B25394D